MTTRTHTATRTTSRVLRRRLHRRQEMRNAPTYDPGTTEHDLARAIDDHTADFLQLPSGATVARFGGHRAVLPPGEAWRLYTDSLRRAETTLSKHEELMASWPAAA